MSNLLPPSATITEVNLDEALSRIENIPTPARTIYNPTTAPSQILPWLAWANSVDNWDVTWSEEQKRAVIDASYDVHRYKGTIGSLKEALGALGYTVEVQEWFNQIPQGEPYTFKLHISVDQVGISAIEFQKLKAIVDNAKNLRSHMDETTLTISGLSNVYCSATVLSGTEIDYTDPAGTLRLDDSWLLDGSEILDGLKGF